MSKAEKVKSMIAELEKSNPELYSSLILLFKSQGAYIKACIVDGEPGVIGKYLSDKVDQATNNFIGLTLGRPTTQAPPQTESPLKAVTTTADDDAPAHEMD